MRHSYVDVRGPWPCLVSGLVATTLDGIARNIEVTDAEVAVRLSGGTGRIEDVKQSIADAARRVVMLDQVEAELVSIRKGLDAVARRA